MRIDGRVVWLSVGLLACQADRPFENTASPKFATCVEDCGGGGGGGGGVPSVRFSTVTTGIGNGGNLQVILLGASDRLPYLLYQVSSSGSWYWRGALPDPGVQLISIATGQGNNGNTNPPLGTFGNLQVLGIGATDGLPYLIYQVESSGSWYWAGQKPNSNGVRFTQVASGRLGSPYFESLYMPALGTNGFVYTAGQNAVTGSWGTFVLKQNSVPLTKIVSLTRPYYKSGVPAGSGIPTEWTFGLEVSDGLPYYLSDFYVDYGGYYSCCIAGSLPNPNGIRFSVLAAGLADYPDAYHTAWNPQVIGLGASDGLPYLIYFETGAYATPRWYWHGLLPNPGNIPFKALATGTGNDANLQVILLGKNDGLPYLIYKVAGGGWHWGGRLPTPAGQQFSAVTTGNGNGGNLQIILLGETDGLPYLLYQVNSGGSWYWRGLLPVQ